AIADFDKALSLNPNYGEAYANKGKSPTLLKRYQDAFPVFEKALAINPNLESAWLGRGNVLAWFKRHDDALVAYDRAFAIKPDLEIVEAVRLYTKMRLCKWDNLENEIGKLTASVRAWRPNPPFPLLSLIGSPDDQLRCAQAWVAAQHPQAAEAVWRGPL